MGYNSTRLRGAPLSKREIRTRKLDTRVLWGVGTGLAAIGAISWFLVRHKSKHKAEERLAELETRTDIRCQILSERIDGFQRRINESHDLDERCVLAELIGQASANLAQIQQERILPSEMRLLLEGMSEAGAEMEESLSQHEDGWVS